MESVVVETSLGRVEGRLEHGVAIFEGIPYAKAPTGPLRFRPPEALEPWGGTRDATKAGYCAYQADVSANPIYQYLRLQYPEQDEDCLNLNVWTPGADGRRRPVMVWIHGGAFVSGAGSLSIYDGTKLAHDGDVVVVTINYRLGVFGFLRLDGIAGEEVGADGNQGLLDQVAALTWVHNEIAAFGGDPTNITVFGESAGAISISALLCMPETTGLFPQAILQSGAPNLFLSPEAADSTAQRIMDDLGLSVSQVERLREMPARDLAAAQDRATPRSEGVFYGPVRGTLVPADPFAAIADGSASGVSLVVGTNLDEMRFFLALDPRSQGMDEARALDLVMRILGGDETARERAEAVYRVYASARAEREDDVSPEAIAFAIATDWTFRYPAMRLAELQSAHTPVYAYLFDWPSPAAEGRLGAAHLVEVPFVFGTFGREEIRDFAGDGPEAEALSEQMRDAWVRFARFGSPTTPLLQEWPAYEPSQRWTMLLGAESTAVTAPLEAERSAWSGSIVTA